MKRPFSHIARIMLSAAVLGFLIGCSEDPQEEVSVISEDVLLINSDNVRLSGRILSLGDVDLEDYGFEVADNDQFNAAITLSLGEGRLNGGFIGEINGLTFNTGYWWRAYITLDGQTQYGSEKQFITQTTGLTDFIPRIGSPASFVTIRGRNFPEDVTVYFGDVEATIFDQTDYSIRVQVPPIGTEYQVNIRVEAPGQSLQFPETYEYIIGDWQSQGSFPVVNRFAGAITIQSSNEIVFGMGRINAVTTEFLWTAPYDNLVWNQVSFPGQKFRDGFFSGKYFGNGVIVEAAGPGGIPTVSNELWSYDNGSFTLESTTPFQWYEALAFDTGTDLYVMGGLLANGASNEEIYSYNYSSGVWSYEGQLPGIQATTSNASFYHDGYIYLLSSQGVLFRYNIVSDNWFVINSYPEGGGEEIHCVLFGDKAYIGFLDGRRTIFEYDITANTWKPKKSIPVSKTLRAYSSWVYNGQIYFLLNTELQGRNGIDVWTFSPDDF